MDLQKTTAWPTSEQDLAQLFGTQEKCLRLLRLVRWKGEAPSSCMGCGLTAISPIKARSGWYSCGGCRRQFSVTSGTIFDRTKMPLPDWMRTFWWVAEGIQPNPLRVPSAYALSRSGIGSVRLNWGLIQKVRCVLRIARKSQQESLIEPILLRVFDLDLGGDPKKIGAAGRPLIALAVEWDNSTDEVGKRSEIRLCRLNPSERDRGTEVANFLRSAASEANPKNKGKKRPTEPVKVMLVPEDPYVRRNDLQEDFRARVASSASGDALVNRIKAALEQDRRGNLAPGHLDYHLDAVAFRYNGGLPIQPGDLFRQLVTAALQSNPMPTRTRKSAKQPAHPCA